MDDSPTYTYRLFKYRSIAGQNRYYTERIIAHGRIYYAAPKQFNDPFDCLSCVNIDGAPLNASGLSKRDEIKAFSENRLWEETNKNFSVLSLSEVNDNILMWSHYSDGHAGICLDLTFEMSEKLHRVQYTDVRPEIYFTDVREQHRDHERFNKSVISTLTTKAPDWAYEKEWRCIDFGGCGERPMPHGMLTGIIFGYRTSETDKRMVHEWVESARQSVRFYQAIQRDGAFALDIKEIH